MRDLPLSIVVLLKTLCIGLATLGLLVSLPVAYILMLMGRTPIGTILIVGIPILLAYALYRAVRRIKATDVRSMIETAIAGALGASVLYFVFQFATHFDV